MAASAIDVPAQPRPKQRGRRALVRAATIAVILLVGWMIIGGLRAEAAARNHFSQSAPGDTHANVTVQVGPAVPPFWTVTISGDVIEPGSPSPKYRSYMRFWIEPLSGWVISFGNG